MIGSNKQDAGDNSTNYQAGNNNNIVNIGLSYGEVKEVVLDTFKANFYQLSEKAAQIVLERVEHITDSVLEKLYREKPHLIEKLQEPSVQSSLINAQKEHAKAGDVDLETMLTDLLIERIDSDERSLKQIVLDEAVLVVAKLSNTHINVLTLLYNITSVYYNATQLGDYYRYLDHLLLFYIPNTLNEKTFKHLQFTGCCLVHTEGRSYRIFTDVVIERYRGLLSKGFSNEEFVAYIGMSLELCQILQPRLIMICPRDNSKLQYSAMNDAVFYSLIGVFEPDIQLKLQNHFISTTMNPEEIKQDALSYNPNLSSLINDWDNSSIRGFLLTSVGGVIAVKNYNKTKNEAMSIDDVL